MWQNKKPILKAKFSHGRSVQMLAKRKTDIVIKQHEEREEEKRLKLQEDIFICTRPRDKYPGLPVDTAATTTWHTSNIIDVTNVTWTMR